ncbi:MAG: tRNA (adenosine(37)-N6)-threonylcarbamoyltransferase complex transferase subunit TsaD [Candidatus Liptonbacteria bacterium]|nr:tRNA (adenosine(37)-N6)-threonylcarbamoyltransferase complex transferase subunit TsaD [Candidatus Liptonbacteria bacterium]
MAAMRILAIETSCDETAIAIVESEDSLTQPADPQTFRILANRTLSQIDVHKEYGGVFPMLAKREHSRALVPLLVKALEDARLYKKTSRHVIESPLRKDFQEILEREPDLFANFVTEVPNIDPPPIDAIAVTQGPGLEPALWVGINFAKALSLVWKKPIIAVNHMEGHVFSAMLRKAEISNFQFSIFKGNPNAVVYEISDFQFPMLALLVSGGHTELVLMSDWGKYKIVGETKDDAVGEAFDKVARILGLPYPGGPEISRLGESGRAGVHPLPRPMLHSPDFDFSFAGLKTAVLYLVKKLGELTQEQKADIAREFEEACVEVLVTKTLRAVSEFGARAVILGGGVSANKRLCEHLEATVKEKLADVRLFLPEPELTTDNALMIAIAAFFRHDHPVKLSDLRAIGNWRIDDQEKRAFTKN